MRPKTITQTFNDGVLRIYKISNISNKGDKPKDGLKAKYTNAIPYEERTVGITRNHLAMQEQSSIEQLVRIPRLNISVHDVVILNGKQYDIYQSQNINNVEPRCLDLSLERLETAYEVVE